MQGKKSAKGVIKLAKRQLTHDRFKETLSSIRLIRTQNHRIASSSHQLHTVTTNKESLNAFDNKRYILDIGIETLPFGHINVVHNRFFDEDDKFDNESLSFLSSVELHKIERQREMETTVETNTDNAEIPDPGFARNAAIRESDFESDEIADEKDIEEERSEYNPFIDYEPIESDS